MKKLPKFFCEHCNREVRQNDKVCPHCGRFFASVKCPSCGFTGDSRVFRLGCPVCGYAVHEGGTGGSRAKVRGSGKAGRSKGAGTDPLPWWLYVVSVGLLALVVVLIIMNAA